MGGQSVGVWGKRGVWLQPVATRTQTEAHKQTPATVHLAVPASLDANQAERDRNIPPPRTDGWMGREAAGGGGWWR